MILQGSQNSIAKNFIFCDFSEGVRTPCLPSRSAHETYALVLLFLFTDCGNHFTLENGFVYFTGKATTFNHSISVECDPGYTLLGDSSIHCQANGIWGSNSTCRLKGTAVDKTNTVSKNDI